MQTERVQRATLVPSCLRCTLGLTFIDYKTDLKDLNDRNWERFKAELQAKLARQRAELIKWMFIFWSGTVIPMVGIFIGIVALLR